MERLAKQSHKDMCRCTPNMQRSCWPLELPEYAMEKHHTEIIHAHATNAAGIPQSTNKP